MQAEDKDRPIAAEGYNVGLIAKVVGANIRTLQSWTEKGLVSPSIREGHRHGPKDVYSFSDIVAFRTIVKLREKNVSLQAIKKAVAWLRQYDSTVSLAQVCLVSDGADIYEKKGAAVRSILRNPGQTVFTWVLDLGEVQQEVRRALREAA